MKKLKLSVGVQGFPSMIEDGYQYVDKTDLVYKMVSEGKAYFLSRPRRFGKSLLCSDRDSMIYDLVIPNREVRQGLYRDVLDYFGAHPKIEVSS